MIKTAKVGCECSKLIAAIESASTDLELFYAVDSSKACSCTIPSDKKRIKRPSTTLPLVVELNKYTLTIGKIGSKAILEIKVLNILGDLVKTVGIDALSITPLGSKNSLYKGSLDKMKLDLTNIISKPGFYAANLAVNVRDSDTTEDAPKSIKTKIMFSVAVDLQVKEVFGGIKSHLNCNHIHYSSDFSNLYSTPK